MAYIYVNNNGQIVDHVVNEFCLDNKPHPYEPYIRPNEDTPYEFLCPNCGDARIDNRGFYSKQQGLFHYLLNGFSDLLEKSLEIKRKKGLLNRI